MAQGKISKKQLEILLGIWYTKIRIYQVSDTGARLSARSPRDL